MEDFFPESLGQKHWCHYTWQNMVNKQTKKRKNQEY